MLLNFIGRRAELEALEDQYNQQRANFVIIYGRRRVGKTELVKQFVLERPHVYFLAKKQPLSLELDRFWRQFMEQTGLAIAQPRNWDELFEQIVERLNGSGKFIIVIDEFPYWIEKDKVILSTIQAVWDEVLARKNVMLILLGSSVGMMETEVMGYRSPLYGRRTAQLRLLPLRFWEIAGFLPGYPMEDLVRVYGCVGGIPYYLREFDNVLDFRGNLGRTFLNKANILYIDAEFLLREELREVANYFNLLRTIGEGESKFAVLASKTQLNITNLPKYLKVLQNLNLIMKETPITQKNVKSHLVRYRIADNYFQFWVRFIYPNLDAIEYSNTGPLLELILERYNDYLGRVFEDIANDALLPLSAACATPFPIRKRGRWWMGDCEIDLVCKGPKPHDTFFIECKWSVVSLKDALRILHALEKKTERYPSGAGHTARQYFGLIAKQISEQNKTRLRNDGYYVWDLQDLFETA